MWGMKLTISSWEPSGTAALENVLEVCLSDLALAVGGLVFILHSKQREFTEGLGRNPSISQKDSRTHRLMLQKKKPYRGSWPGFW